MARGEYNRTKINSIQKTAFAVGALHPCPAEALSMLIRRLSLHLYNKYGVVVSDYVRSNFGLRSTYDHSNILDEVSRGLWKLRMDQLSSREILLWAFHLRVVLDPKLNWRLNIEMRTKYGCAAFYVCKWTYVRIIPWMYTAMDHPILT